MEYVLVFILGFSLGAFFAGYGAFLVIKEKFVRKGKPPKNGDILKDGHGSQVSIVCPQCGGRTMQIVRPGKIQCSECG